MSALSRLSRLAASVNAASWGETIRIIPMAGGGYSARAADPARPAASVPAITSFENADGNFEGNRRGSEMAGTTVSTRRPARAYLTLAAYSGLGYEVAQHDGVELVGHRAPGIAQRYAVTRVVKTDTGDVILELAISDEVFP